MRPTVSTIEATQCSSGLRPAIRMGRTMFSAAVMVGNRLNDWKMKPIRSRRSSVSALSLSDVISVSPRYTSPEVGRSRPASRWSRVDLPEPEGPMMAVN